MSVIIPARDAQGVVAAAVRSALEQDYPNIVEVVVAAADDDTAAAATAIADERVMVVHNRSGLTPQGLNLALGKIGGEVVVRCDAHAALPPGYVARAVTTLGATGAVNVGGRQVPVSSDLFGRAVALAMVSPLGAGDARYRIGGEPGPVDTVYLGVFLRSALVAAGGFDETMLRNQDYEMNWRLRERGGTIWFDPELAVLYQPRTTLPGLWRQYFGYGQGKRHMLRRHPGSVRARQLAAPSLVLGLVAAGGLALFGHRWALVAPAAYGGITAAAGVVDSIRHRSLAGLLEPPALWTMHVSWGAGFLLGPSARR